MPAGTITRIPLGYTHSTRKQKSVYKNRYGRKKWGRLRRVPRGIFRKARPGGRSLVIPIKTGYQYDITGTGASFLNFDSDVGLHLCPPDFFSRYEPIFNYIRINKCRIEITCPYNIGQHMVGTQSLYRMWSKKAISTAEVPPGSITEWLNMQNAKRSTFSGTNNSVNYYFTPGYETTVQPLNVAVTSLRVLYKQWQTIRATPGAMTPHIGILGQMHRMDGSVIGNTNVFKVNVTLYCQLKGIKQL